MRLCFEQWACSGLLRLAQAPGSPLAYVLTSGVWGGGGEIKMRERAAASISERCSLILRLKALKLSRLSNSMIGCDDLS